MDRAYRSFVFGFRCPHGPARLSRSPLLRRVLLLRCIDRGQISEGGPATCPWLARCRRRDSWGRYKGGDCRPARCAFCLPSRCKLASVSVRLMRGNRLACKCRPLPAVTPTIGIAEANPSSIANLVLCVGTSITGAIPASSYPLYVSCWIAKPDLTERLRTQKLCRLRSPASGKSPSLARLSPIVCDVPANHGAQQAVGQRLSALPRVCSPIARHIAQPIDTHKEAGRRHPSCLLVSSFRLAQRNTTASHR